MKKKKNNDNSKLIDKGIKNIKSKKIGRKLITTVIIVTMLLTIIAPIASAIYSSVTTM